MATKQVIGQQQEDEVWQGFINALKKFISRENQANKEKMYAKVNSLGTAMDQKIDEVSQKVDKVDMKFTSLNSKIKAVQDDVKKVVDLLRNRR